MIPNGPMVSNLFPPKEEGWREMLVVRPIGSWGGVDGGSFAKFRSLPSIQEIEIRPLYISNEII